MINRLLFLLLLLGWFSPLFAAEIIAHRGASYEAPENTLPAMKRAWEESADAIELDLRLSKDNQIVVIHDEDANRVASFPKKIAESLWEELRTLDVGSWKNPAFKGERIPNLLDILQTIPPGKKAFLEIKCGPEILPELKRILDEAKTPSHQLVIISFGFETLKRSKQMFPEVEHYFLHDFKTDKPPEEQPTLQQLISRARQAGFDGLNLNYKWPFDEAFVQNIKREGLKIYTWTVNDPQIAESLVHAGVDGITTDRPAWLRERIRKSP